MVPPFMPLSRRDRAPSFARVVLIASNENAVRNGALSYRVTFGPNVACTAPGPTPHWTAGPCSAGITKLLDGQ